MLTIFTILILVFTPALLIWLALKYPILDKIGVVAITFVAGMLVAVVLPFLLQQFGMYFEVAATSQAILLSWQTAQAKVLDVSIALALPMLVFSFDIRHSVNKARRILFAMSLAVFAVCMMTLISAFIFTSQLANIWQHAGLAVGAYVGGGVNMAVIQTATQAHQAVFITMTSYDLLLSSIYVMLILTVGVPIAQKILPPFNNNLERNRTDQTKNNSTNYSESSLKNGLGNNSESSLENDKLSTVHSKEMHNTDENAAAFKQLLELKLQKYHALSLLFAGGIVAAAVFLAGFLVNIGLVSNNSQSTVTIVLITTLAIAASTLKIVNRLPTSFGLGMYLVMVFCFTAGSMLDGSVLLQDNLSLLLFMSMIVFGSVVLHLFLCKLFKVDADSFLVTSVASIMSLPFIPLITNRINNRSMMVPAMFTAIIGYVVGTYLGILLTLILKRLLA